jgi:hypothetical protein
MRAMRWQRKAAASCYPAASPPIKKTGEHEEQVNATEEEPKSVLVDGLGPGAMADSSHAVRD